MTALFGPSGCGKTTLFMTLLKCHRYSGSILINGKSLDQIPEQQLVERESLTVIFTSHDKRLVQEWADRCYVVADGMLAETDPLEV